MKKILFLVLVAMLGVFAGCSSQNAGSSSKESEIVAKELEQSDVDALKIGVSEDELLQSLGKPKKLWKDDAFIYTELAAADSRAKLTHSIIKQDGDEELLDYGEKALKMDNLKLYQYDYSNGDGETETFLAWVKPDTKKVVYANSRRAIDTAGSDIESSSQSSTGKTTTSSSTASSVAPATIGETCTFSNKSGDKVAVSIDSVTKDTGDGDYYIPKNGYFAKVDFTVANNGTEPFKVSAHNFDFYDGKGLKGKLNSRDFFTDTIQPGKSVTGTAYFDIENDTSDYEVFFADSSWAGSY